MNMREADIPLDILKMPTLPPNLKPDERAKLEAYKAKVKEAQQAAEALGQGRGRRSKVNVEFGQDLPSLVMKLTFFDPPSLFKNIIASDIFKSCYQGPAIFVDELTELFQSHAWLSSVCFTNGVYAHVWVNGVPMSAIFPSDFIYFCCYYLGCYCHRIRDEDDNTYDLHIGRVYGVGFDC